MKLNELADRPGSRKKRMRVGRGIGSGMGKTGGRGGKGQTARSGVRIKGFEGGQMPLHRRLPKRGFNNVSTRDYNEVGLDRIQQAVDSGRLDKGATVNAAALKAAGIIRRNRDGVRILANGELKAKLAFEIEGASAGARAAIEKAGGKVTIVGAAAARAARAAAAAEGKTAE
jgi:large subunit ribosomal protein L15